MKMNCAMCFFPLTKDVISVLKASVFLARAYYFVKDVYAEACPTREVLRGDEL